MSLGPQRNIRQLEGLAEMARLEYWSIYRYVPGFLKARTSAERRPFLVRHHNDPEWLNEEPQHAQQPASDATERADA